MMVGNLEPEEKVLDINWGIHEKKMLHSSETPEDPWREGKV